MCAGLNTSRQKLGRLRRQLGAKQLPLLAEELLPEDAEGRLQRLTSIGLVAKRAAFQNTLDDFTCRSRHTPLCSNPRAGPGPLPAADLHEMADRTQRLRRSSSDSAEAVGTSLAT
jgi:hypothetical protein